MSKKGTTLEHWKSRALKAESRLELRETELQCRALIRWFADQMLNRFRSNADRGSGWSNKTPQELLGKLEENVEDLRKALGGKAPLSVMRRCADVANVAAMIADRVDST